MRQIDDKIKVFISSKIGDKHGDEKYIIARKAVKELLESMNIFSVYSFEDKGASIISAGDHYKNALIDSDVCIFLIDNKDGISPGVQIELDTAEKYRKPSLFYFCTQWKTKKTQLQLSLEKANKPKHYNVSSFSSFIERCPGDLLESILDIFINYSKPIQSEEDTIANLISDENKEKDLKRTIIPPKNLSISESILENILCRNYFSDLLLGNNPVNNDELEKNFDFYCAKFLTTMFENNSIDNINISLLLDSLKPLIPNDYFRVVKKRWYSNIKYYTSDYEDSYNLLLEAYEDAKDNIKNVDDWFINDILIDLRNRQDKILKQKNQYTNNNFGQNELGQRSEKIYYPILDRCEKNILNWIDKDRQKNDLRPYNSWSTYGDLSNITNNIADFYYQAMIFGSFTQLSRVYILIQKFTYHIGRTTEYWPTILMLFKTTIINLDYKGTQQISRNFSEILQKMNPEDARDIYNFSMNAKPIEDQFIANLIAMSEVGYYLNDTDFTSYWNKLEQKITLWNEDKDSIVALEPYIFRCLERISERLDDNYIVDFSLIILSSEKRRYHSNALKLISNNYVNYSKISKEISNKTIDTLIEFIKKNNNNSDEVDRIKTVFILLENMDKQHKEDLEMFIQKEWPDFYSSEYQFEKNRHIDSEKALLDRFIIEIDNRNDIQGRNGAFVLYGNNPYSSAMNIIQEGNEPINNEILNKLFISTADTILLKTQTINDKVSAYKLAIYLLRCHPELSKCNEELSKKLTDMKDYDQAKETMINHIDNTVCTLCHLLLLEVLGKNKYKEIVETLSFFGDSGRQIEGCKILKVFLYNHENVKIRPAIESLILQIILLWSNSKNIDVRWHNVILQLKFYELKKYRKVIGQNLQSIANIDNAIVKSQVLHHLETIRKYDAKLASTICKVGEVDNNFVIRKIIAKYKR